MNLTTNIEKFLTNPSNNSNSNNLSPENQYQTPSHNNFYLDSFSSPFDFLNQSNNENEPQIEYNTIFNQKTTLPIKPNPKMLKKRPNTALAKTDINYNNYHLPSPLQLTQIFNQKMKNNFVRTPMKGVFRGGYDEEFNEEFTPITVFGEIAKIYR